MITKKNPPYQDTAVDKGKTKAAIEKLFREYGVSGVQWTENYQTNEVSLRFMVEAEVGGIRRNLGLEVKPPLLLNKHKSYNPRTGRTETINAPNYAQSYRLLYYWLKAKLEAVSYGLSSIEKEFLSQVVVKINGRDTTVGDAFATKIIDNQLQAPRSNQAQPVGDDQK